MNRTVLLIILIVLLIAVLPSWPYSVGWGYYPSGGLGLVLLILLILLLLGRIGTDLGGPVTLFPECTDARESNPNQQCGARHKHAANSDRPSQRPPEHQP